MEFTSKNITFLAYFGCFPGVFFGNVGRYADIYFPERLEAFNMETTTDENLLNNNSNTAGMKIEKKMARFKSHDISNRKVYKARLQKLLLTYDHLLKVLQTDKKREENMALLFQKFLLELHTLQENFKYQRDSIIQNHMIDMFEDNSFDVQDLDFN